MRYIFILKGLHFLSCMELVFAVIYLAYEFLYVEEKTGGICNQAAQLTCCM
jgi:hypothetical protein